MAWGGMVAMRRVVTLLDASSATTALADRGAVKIGRARPNRSAWTSKPVAPISHRTRRIETRGGTMHSCFARACSTTP